MVAIVLWGDRGLKLLQTRKNNTYKCSDRPLGRSRIETKVGIKSAIAAYQVAIVLWGDRGLKPVEHG